MIRFRAAPHSNRRAACGVAAVSLCCAVLTACGQSEEPAPTSTTAVTSAPTTTTVFSTVTTTSPSPVVETSPPLAWTVDNLRGAPGNPPAYLREPPVNPQDLAPRNTRCLSYTPPGGSATDNVITRGVTSCASANDIIFAFMFDQGGTPGARATVRNWDCQRNDRADTPDITCSCLFATVRAIPRDGQRP